jgi:hypothetical protein
MSTSKCNDGPIIEYHILDCALVTQSHHEVGKGSIVIGINTDRKHQKRAVVQLVMAFY